MHSALVIRKATCERLGAEWPARTRSTVARADVTCALDSLQRGAGRSHGQSWPGRPLPPVGISAQSFFRLGNCYCLWHFLSLLLPPSNGGGNVFALVYWLGNWLETGLREKFLTDCGHHLWVGWLWPSDQVIRFGGEPE